MGVVHDDLYRITWARIPHLFRSPFYVYQYATCFASSAKLFGELSTGSESDRANALHRYLKLLRSGGNDYPMEQLLEAGVDLRQPSTVQAVVNQLSDLVDRLETEVSQL